MAYHFRQNGGFKMRNRQHEQRNLRKFAWISIFVALLMCVAYPSVSFGAIELAAKKKTPPIAAAQTPTLQPPADLDPAVRKMVDELDSKRKSFLEELRTEASEVRTKLDSVSDAGERTKMIDEFRAKRKEKIETFQEEDKMLEDSIMKAKGKMPAPPAKKSTQ